MVGTETRPNHILATDYLAPSECRHPPPLVTLANGETACYRCCHVARRRDGTRAVYVHSAGHGKTARLTNSGVPATTLAAPTLEVTERIAVAKFTIQDG